MLGSWDLELDGRVYRVTVERSETGKDVVRVDGRVATKPIAPEEDERGVTIGNRAYIVRRTGRDAYELVEDEFALPPQSFTPAQRGPATHEVRKAAGLSGPNYFGLFLKIAVAAVVIGLLGGIYTLINPGYKKQARQRVSLMLSDMKSGANVDMQFSIGYFYLNKRVLDRDEMNIGSDKFDKWRNEKDIYNKPFKEFKILDATLEKDAAVETAIVTFTLDGKEYKVRVPKNQTMSWAE